MAFEEIEKGARNVAWLGEWQLRFAQAVQTILLPALIAAIVWFREQILQTGGALFFVLLAVFVSFQLFLFILGLVAKQSVQDLYFHAKDLKESADSLRLERDGLLKRAELYSFIEKYAAACSSSLLSYSGQTLDWAGLERVVKNVLEPLVANGEDIFGFGPSEKWNFVVYIYHQATDELVAVWREKGQAHPSEGLGRKWRRGQGHVGFAFANARAVITEDGRDQDVRNLVTAPEGHRRDYDEDVYVSFASIPIGPVGAQLEPLGVLVATSDRAGRFSSENSRIFAQAALALANCISMMAPATVATLNTVISSQTGSSS
jgi:hypothetical protein